MKLEVFASPAFFQALDDFMQQDLPVRAAYQLSKAYKVLVEESKRFEESRKKIIEKYAKRDETGNLMLDENKNALISAENAAKIQEEFADLFSIEFEVPTTSLSDLGEVSIPLKNMTQLSDLFH